MMILGIAFGLALGLFVGGSLLNLASIRLRRSWLLAFAVLIRYGTEAILSANFAPAEAIRLPLLASVFAVLLVAVWINRSYPGLSLAFVGILFNAVVIVVNGGYMPVWEPSLRAAGLLPSDITSSMHTLLPMGLDASFLLHLGPLSDVIPVPLPFIENVVSVGDLFLTAGLAFFLFASVVHAPDALPEEDPEAIRQRLAGYTSTSHRTQIRYGAADVLETGLTPRFIESVVLYRAVVLGGPVPLLSSPSPTVELPVPRLAPEAVGRVRQHPYVRLALNGSFSALWAGQLISLLGDRLHQLALVAVVLISTGSPVATGLVFVAATLPNLVLSPIAGTFVDRWDHKEVLIVSDILRAALVLLLPLAAITNVVLVYPMVFALTTISIFFRPARVAILPQIVEERDLLTANSALWVGETIADVVGYPLAGIFVVTLGAAIPLAFWVDSATYLASATMLTTIIVRARRPGQEETQVGLGKAGFLGELKAGWAFLRSEATLFANTIQAAVGQFTIGIAIALAPVYALNVFGSHPVGWEAVYGFLETGIGVGNLIGGFVIGLLGARLAKGRMVIAGYTFWGLMITLMALTNHLGLAIGFSVGQGIFNMVFLIPSQTLFQQRTPPSLMGRVVALRFAMVFGPMTLAMGLGSVLAEAIGVVPVLAFFGITSMVAGLAGLWVPAIRDA